MLPRHPIARPRTAVFLLCLLVNLVVLTSIQFCNPEYLRNHRLAESKDGNGYVQIGKNLVLLGEYSRNEQAPYTPNIHRPPIYPALAGCLIVPFGAIGIYVAQIFFHAIACVILFEIGLLCFSRRVGLLAASWLATDFVVISFVFKPQSEAVFIVLLLAGLRFVVVPLVENCSVPRAATFSALGGLFLGLSILTRPAGMYLPMLCILFLIGVSLFRRNFGQALILPVLFGITVYAGPFLWIARNQAVFNLPRLTTTDAQMAVYYLGTAAYQIEHDISRKEAHEMICEEFDLPPHHKIHNVDFEGGDIRQMYLKVKGAAKSVLLKYPRATIQAGAIGITKTLTAHTGSDYGVIFDCRRSANDAQKTDRSGLLEKAGRFLSHHPAILLLIAWELVLHLGSLLLAVPATLDIVLRRKPYPPAAWLLLIITAYFCALPAMSAFVASSRAGIPIWPLLYLIAANGLTCFIGQGKVHHE